MSSRQLGVAFDARVGHKPIIVRPVPLFRRKSKEPPAAVEHAVILHVFRCRATSSGPATSARKVFALEDRIIEAVQPIGGDHDGHEFGAGEAVLYTYGRDANELFDAVSGALGDFPLRPGAFARAGRRGTRGDLCCA